MASGENQFDSDHAVLGTNITVRVCRIKICMALRFFCISSQNAIGRRLRQGNRASLRVTKQSNAESVTILLICEGDRDNGKVNRDG